jgi:imidazolonepropionase
MFKLLLRDADRVVLVSQDREPFKTGDALNDLRIKEHYSVVVAADGLIAAVGPASAIEEKYPLDQFVKVVDCRGMTVLPGFVDAHTHALFEGDRTF